MSDTTKKIQGSFFERFAARVTKATGSTAAFISALMLVFLWLLSGPLFNYSETWQLIINTGTTIITFLMVFLIQKTQNKDSLAIQLKLNELVASHEYASNRLVYIEDLTEEELITIQKYYRSLSERSRKEKTLFLTHSIDEAQYNHEYKEYKSHRKRKQHIDRGNQPGTDQNIKTP